VRHAVFLSLAALVVDACSLDFNRFDSTGGATDARAEGATGEGGAGEDGGGEAGTLGDGGCTTSSACSGSAHICNKASGKCVVCLTNTDCGPTLPSCDPQTFTCRPGCTSDGQCAAGQPYCDPTSAQCVRCIDNTNCDGTSTPYCSTNGECVECLQSAQCPKGDPVCTAGSCGQ